MGRYDRYVFVSFIFKNVFWNNTEVLIIIKQKYMYYSQNDDYIKILYLKIYILLWDFWYFNHYPKVILLYRIILKLSVKILCPFNIKSYSTWC